MRQYIRHAELEAMQARGKIKSWINEGMGYHEIKTMYPAGTILPAGVRYPDIVIDTCTQGEWQIAGYYENQSRLRDFESTPESLLTLWDKSEHLWLDIDNGDNGRGFAARIRDVTGGVGDVIFCLVFAIDTHYCADIEASEK